MKVPRGLAKMANHGRQVGKNYSLEAGSQTR